MYGDRYEKIGPPEHCVCGRCGYRVQHTPGMPCYKMVCPTCGITLRREA